MGWGELRHSKSGGVSKSGDSFVYALPAKLLMKNLRIASQIAYKKFTIKMCPVTCLPSPTDLAPPHLNIFPLVFSLLPLAVG